MTDKSIWDKDIPVPVKVIQFVDEAVREKLPPGTEIVDISPSGASYWARTAKIAAVNADGEETPFFIKVDQNELGKKAVSAEFYGMSKLFQVMPEIVSEPMGWGTYKTDPNIHFYICRFRDLSDDIPSASDFPALLAEMHKRGASKDAKFGWPVTSYGGRKARWYPVRDTWEDTFTTGIKQTFKQEQETHGPDPELDKLRQGLLEKVIPRLLRPLETEGRKIIPTIVHGDIWDGNVSVDENTGMPLIFDALPTYAHSEYDLAPWFVPRHRMTGEYVAEYKKHVEISKPVEDFDDRGLLYSIWFDMQSSSLYEGNRDHRNYAMNNMRRLLEKYPLGYEGYLKEKGTQSATAQ